MRQVTINANAIAVAKKSFLTKDGFPKLVRANRIRAYIQKYGLINWIGFCYEIAVYVYPTVELVKMLELYIELYADGDRNKVIEIASGNSRLFKHLGIKGTDSYCQQMPEVKQRYQDLFKRETTCNRPPEKTGVEKLEALDAIAKYQPQLVIGCYATPSWDEELESGNYWGVDYQKLLEEVRSFIMVGNEKVSDKLLAKFNYEGKIFDKNIITSSQDQSANCIYDFRGKGKTTQALF